MEESSERGKIRSMLTPEVMVCGECRQEYQELATCASCGQNMLHPDYEGMVHECPLCGEMYCQECWNKMEGKPEV